MQRGREAEAMPPRPAALSSSPAQGGEKGGALLTPSLLPAPLLCPPLLPPPCFVKARARVGNGSCGAQGEGQWGCAKGAEEGCWRADPRL